MDNETKDTLKKVAEYATEESNKRKERLRTMLAGSTCLMLISYIWKLAIPFGSWKMMLP